MASFWKRMGLVAALIVPITTPSAILAQGASKKPHCASMPTFPHATGPSTTPLSEPPPWITPEPTTPEPITPEPITPEPITPEPTTPEPTTPEPTTPEPTTPEPTTPDSMLSFGTAQAGLGSPDVAFTAPGGYIDNPIPRTRLTLRFDAAYDNPTPDRVEFFYGKCGCFRAIDPDAPGPRPDNPTGGRTVETSVDYQEFWLNMEYAFLENRASAFVELPVRLINPEINDNEIGLGDINFGLKYALVATRDQYFTLQLRVYSPTGDAGEGLGTDHFSIEPAVLYLQQLDQDWSLFGELRHWIPINGSDGPVFPGGGGDEFSSNVLRYGVGVAYNLIDSPSQGYQVSPVVELVGWHVFDGFVSSSPDGRAANIVIENGHASIVNSKVGMRFTYGKPTSNFAGYGGDQSLYVGWGHALTNDDDAWYKNVLRVEYRLNF